MAYHNIPTDVLEYLEGELRQWEHIPIAAQAIQSCIDDLKLIQKSSYLGVLYQTEYQVTGRGAFPIDMLRYSQSWPKEESAARQIEDSCEHGGIDDVFTVVLVKNHRDRTPQLSEERWEQRFHWKVKLIETRRL